MILWVCLVIKWIWATGQLEMTSYSIGVTCHFNYSLEVDDLILSSIASATMVAGPDLRRAGTVVLDIGAGVTDFASLSPRICSLYRCCTSWR